MTHQKWCIVQHNAIYPVKMTIEKHQKIEESQIHFIVAAKEIKKELLSSLVPQHNVEKHGVLERPFPYVITVSDIVKNFKREHSFLLKHFPDEMLSDNQLRWKYRAISRDLKKEGLIIDENYKLIDIEPKAIYRNRIILSSEIRDIDTNVFDSIPNISEIEIIFPHTFNQEETEKIIKNLSDKHKQGPSTEDNC